MDANLEKRVLENPQDRNAHQEYAQALKKAGDPLGKFIEVQLKLDDAELAPEKRFELERQERDLLASHGRQWLGDVADFVLVKDTFNEKPGCKVWFRYGWVQGIQLDELNLKLATLLLKSPQMRLLRRLVLTEALNATCDYLHEWGLLDKIKELDLSYGRITDKGAETLADDKSIRKLEVLDLTGNQLTEVGLAKIRKAFPRVLVDDQNPLVVSRELGGTAAPDADDDGE